MISMSTKYVTLKPHALFFQALANPARMQILALLREKGSRSVSQICNDLGLEQTYISHNLKCLTFCGLVTVQREGKSRIYSVNKQTVLPLLEITDRHLREYASNLFTCEELER
jgi:ArsR family transcriptional regulator